MHPKTKSSLLWGVVAGLAFLVLLQGYELLAATPVAVWVKAVVAVVVAAAATGLTYAMDDRLPGNESP